MEFGVMAALRIYPDRYNAAQRHINPFAIVGMAVTVLSTQHTPLLCLVRQQ